MRISVLCLVAGDAAAANSASAAVSYWDFNVFSRSTIGSSGQAYGSDFQGASAAVGSAWFNGFTVRGLANSSPSIPGGFYGGGNFSLGGSVDHGGLFVAGDVTLLSASVAGDIHAGGNLAGTSGTVNGSVFLGGTKTASNQLAVNGGVTSGQAYTAPIDLNAASAYFLNTSTYAASLSPSTGYGNNYGELLINTGGNALTVVNIAAGDFVNAWGVRVTGMGTVVVNVGGAALNLAYKTWSYQGGASVRNTLLNLHEAETLNLTSGGVINILAPKAATNYTSGVVEGDLIVGSLTGSGQVNWNGGFDGGSVIPAPSVVAVAGAGLLAGLRRRR